jgi:hypothetical protein
MIIDPWGIPLRIVEDGPGIGVAEINFERLREIRTELPSWQTGA